MGVTEGMKYAGPLAVSPRDWIELADYCNSEDRKPNILFYYWGVQGEQIVAVRETALADQANFPAVFRNLDWRDGPYRVSVVEPEEFITGMTEEVIASPDSVTEPFDVQVDLASAGTTEPEPVRIIEPEPEAEQDTESDGTPEDLQPDA